MDGRFNSNPFLHDQDKLENSPEHSGESPPSSAKLSSISSPKRSRRAMQKRVVSVPIRDVENSRLKGEGAPPSDSWAWRKYGQKPIKGSPYPRGYYRCSSSKGCPARKQVERSRVDPTMLVVTYSCEHNHPWPASRNQYHHSSAAASPPGGAATTTTTTSPSEPTVDSLPEEKPDLFTTRHDIDNFVDIGGSGNEFGWFSDMDTSSSTMLESPVFVENGLGDVDTAVYFPMGEEDASLFADLEELPECSVVFRRVVVERRPQLSELSAEIS